MINVEMVLASIGPSKVPIYTIRMTYPRFAHAELMTHRAFSRNASSSRAIPVSQQILAVTQQPAIPLKFTSNQRGMQGGAELEDTQHALETWLSARDHAVEHARVFAAMGLHKQYANRVLEPFAHITVVVTSTDWANFDALRDHEQALPEMHLLAQKVKQARTEATLNKLQHGGWHTPFVPGEKPMPIEAFGFDEDGLPTFVKLSVARCARTSYRTHAGEEPEFRADMQLHDKLAVTAPLHASPAEHQAMAIGDRNVRSGNFRGWIQYRKTLPNECVLDG